MSAQVTKKSYLVCTILPPDMMGKIEEIRQKYRMSYSSIIRAILAKSFNEKTTDEIAREILTTQGVSEPE